MENTSASITVLYPNKPKYSFKSVKTATGQELSVLLFEMEGQEGMLVTKLPELLGVDASTIAHHIRDNGLTLLALGHESRKELQEQGVIGRIGRPPMFAPKDTVRALVKRVGTTKAEAIYNQLWDVAVAASTTLLDFEVEQPKVLIFQPLRSVASNFLATTLIPAISLHQQDHYLSI